MNFSQDQWSIVRLVGDSLTMAPMEVANSGHMDYEAARILYEDAPEIHVHVKGYANTSGPRGGIGGQALSSFPMCILIWDMHGVAFINASCGCYCVCRTTPEFIEAARSGTLSWKDRAKFALEGAKS